MTAGAGPVSASVIVRSVTLFVLAGLMEIGGGYLVWLWLWESRAVWLGALGGLVLFLYGVIPTFQPTHFGRVYAAYGGVFVVLSLLWGWCIDGRAPDPISRQNVQRKITIQSNVARRDVSGVVEEIRMRVEGEVELSDRYFVSDGGRFESAWTATRRILLLSLASLAAIFLLLYLYLEFQSIRQTLLVMVNLPLALVGGVLAVLLTDPVLSVATLVGVITSFGIAVRYGIPLVSLYNDLVAECESLADAVWNGSMERLSPISMTVLTAGLALLPLALSRGDPGDEIQGPLGVVVLGALFTALVLDMLVVSVLFSCWGVRDLPGPWRRSSRRPRPGVGAGADP